MNINIGYPPNIEKIKNAFPIRSNTIFTYGDTIYAPMLRGQLPPDIIAHEEIHARQQGEDPEAWWDRYIVDKEFRLNQEVQAYRTQYRFFCRFIKDRGRQFQLLRIIASDLASPLYGNLVPFLTATQLIKS